MGKGVAQPMWVTGSFSFWICGSDWCFNYSCRAVHDGEIAKLNFWAL